MAVFDSFHRSFFNIFKSDYRLHRSAQDLENMGLDGHGRVAKYTSTRQTNEVLTP